METTTVIERKWRMLNAANQKQASDFMDFLLSRQQQDAEVSKAARQEIRLGVWKDEPHYISEDFDAPLDDFKNLFL